MVGERCGIMQVVIDIDERLYEIITNPKKLPTMYHASRCADAVRNGTPLPKRHGRLIDADYKVSSDGRTIDVVCGYIAPTIIEADKGE
jgi:hypothetical protein